LSSDFYCGRLTASYHKLTSLFITQSVFLHHPPTTHHPTPTKTTTRQFYKYNKILDVSCVLQSDIYSANFADNRQVGDAVPDFSDGTMAIIAGPDYFVKKANYFLQGRGFPAEVICSLD